ncbi:sulfite exporter TauE/SafE family protein, partial [Mycobacterium sp.]|uniref:sulfite exporter TauE/SafE family protein n=1 Tax=Mycobacterium sp. TaxID=1785 RepID=UPI002D401EBF
AGLDAKQAITTSLLVVGVTAAVGATTHARAGRVQWRTAALFGSAAMAGAYSGGLLAHFIPATALMIAFAAVMIAAAIAMLRGRRNTAAPMVGHLPMVKMAILGAGVGMLSGLVGAGGGFLLVPALALLGGLSMPAAVGTSLVIISMQSFAGLAGHLASQHIDWRLAGMVTAAAVIGSLIGGRLTVIVDPNTLRQLFGWFVLLMASVILAQEVHPALGATAAVTTLIAASVSLTCSKTRFCPLRRLVDHPNAAATAT